MIEIVYHFDFVIAPEHDGIKGNNCKGKEKVVAIACSRIPQASRIAYLPLTGLQASR